jgi:uncharacterized membrane protein
MAEASPSPTPPGQPQGGSVWLAGGSAGVAAVAARAGLLLVIEGAALALGVAYLLLGNRLPSFVGKNALPIPARNGVLAAVLAGALAPIVTAVVVAWRRSRRDPARAVRAAETVARVALPLIPLAAYPALLHAQPWFGTPLTYVVILGAFALLLERSLLPALGLVDTRLGQAWNAGVAFARRRSLAPLLVVLIAAGAYSAYTGYLTVLNHHRFGTGAWDLAIYDNLMFNALSGHPFRSTVLYGSKGGNSLGGHAEYGMLLFLPIYALRPRAETLLILQAVMLGAAAVPLYFFAATQLPRWWAVGIALAYLMYPAMQAPQFYDFHWLPLGTFFLFLLLYAISARKNRLCLAAVLLLFALREDLAPGVAAIGLYLMASSERPRLGAVLAGTGAVWFAVNKFVIMPAIGTWWFEALYKDLVAPGEKGYGSVMKTLLANPLFAIGTLLTQAKLEYLLMLLAPLAFLPLRRATFLLLMLPGLLFTLLVTGYGPSVQIKYQYTTHWIAYLFAATVIALRWLGQRAPRRALAAQLALSAAMLSHSIVFGVVLEPSSFIGAIIPVRFSMTAEEKQRYHDLREIIAKIPPRASVSSTDFEAPHVSNRPTVYALAQDNSAGEYLLVSTDSLPLGATREHVRGLLTPGRYGLVARTGGARFYLFRQGLQSPDTAAATAELLAR